MTSRFLLCLTAFSCVVGIAVAQPVQPSYNGSTGESWSYGYGSEEGGSGGSSYMGVDISDVSPEQLAQLKLKEEHGAEITMVDQDAPAGKAGLKVHDVIVSLNGTAVESAAQLRRMIKETPAGRVVNIGISRDGQPQTIKLQLADRHKSMEWEPNVHVEMPEIPQIPSMPDFDVPVSVVYVHSPLRSGLMLENITAQLGEFFGVRGGKGVLIRSVEKGSRGEKAGFRAGDVVVKVNNQSVNDTSDFTHVLRSSSGTSIGVTVMRDKREQNLTLTLPEKKDSGSLQKYSFEIPHITAEMTEAIDRSGVEVAGLDSLSEEMNLALRSADRDLSAIDKRMQELEKTKNALSERQKDMQEQDRDQERDQMQMRMKEQQQALQDRQKELGERRQELQEREQKLRREHSRVWAEI